MGKNVDYVRQASLTFQGTGHKEKGEGEGCGRSMLMILGAFAGG